ncbi:survival protein sure-like phosphatase/nucleotidase [Leucosporidium creatinivorum]|uniref:Survival protein sure-like phosphatase/nucleotidase n=1 Tax=Leucosporidium creatinivorum TaxID=106004 RepID=A0A1Y2FTV3_9BASI|nr:survival protein sure-like phosphatase/nucleotidase [Leucosporidium creatinivorum]
MAAPGNSKGRAPRILLTNDDGPPEPGHSPFIYAFAEELARSGWEVKVVVPSSQRSWVSKAYLISQETTGQYYYPRGPDGTQGERTDLPRPLKEGEHVEWILLDGTPATCSNIALHSLYPPGSFDLVITGPNHGQNASTAFALSSGTLGAAMSAAISGVPSIALSWGLMTGYRPPGKDLISAAATASCKVVKRLYELGFGEGENKAQVYSVNVPLMPSILDPSPEVQWTTMALTSYERLFKSISEAPGPHEDEGGPSALPLGANGSAEVKEGDEDRLKIHVDHLTRPLKFVFEPDLTALLNPPASSLKEGTDTHALLGGAISITPIKTAFAAADIPASANVAQTGLKWRL